MVSMTVVTAFKRHAVENYNKGFDMFVEAYTDAELIEYLDGCKNLAQAVTRANDAIRVWKNVDYDDL